MEEREKKVLQLILDPWIFPESFLIKENKFLMSYLLSKDGLVNFVANYNTYLSFYNFLHIWWIWKWNICKHLVNYWYKNSRNKPDIWSVKSVYSPKPAFSSDEKIEETHSGIFRLMNVEKLFLVTQNEANISSAITIITQPLPPFYPVIAILSPINEECKNSNYFIFNII